MSDRPSTLPPSDRFLEGLLRNMIPVAHEVRWNAFTRAHHISNLCAVGSTSAAQMCRWMGYDPDEYVRLRKMGRS